MEQTVRVRAPTKSCATAAPVLRSSVLEWRPSQTKSALGVTSTNTSPELSDDAFSAT
jgi:hypothetical protein